MDCLAIKKYNNYKQPVHNFIKLFCELCVTHRHEWADYGFEPAAIADAICGGYFEEFRKVLEQAVKYNRAIYNIAAGLEFPFSMNENKYLTAEHTTGSGRESWEIRISSHSSFEFYYCVRRPKSIVFEFMRECDGTCSCNINIDQIRFRHYNVIYDFREKLEITTGYDIVFPECLSSAVNKNEYLDI